MPQNLEDIQLYLTRLDAAIDVVCVDIRNETAPLKKHALQETLDELLQERRDASDRFQRLMSPDGVNPVKATS